MSLRVLVCGSRAWTEPEPIRRELEALYAAGFEEVVHGGAMGADSLAGAIAHELGYSVRCVPADWRRHGRAAGPLRNARMLSEHSPDLVLAFTHDLAKSRGTSDMVRKAREAGVQVRVIPTDAAGDAE
ncbi:MAG: DUF2493 domain-containing protein [Chloroflexota bacterium]|nr:DUF2493 domain-containing protein [Chloroflexota bacterium]